MSHKVNFEVYLEEYDDVSQLQIADRQLLNSARANCIKAYAPYSNFLVGAAVLLSNGHTITGSNQENIAFPSGLCAERVAMFAAAANFPGITIRKIAVSASMHGQDNYQPVTPCGGCRQVISEYQTLQNSPIEIIMEGVQGKIQIVETIDMLLPFKFFAKLDHNQ